MVMGTAATIASILGSIGASTAATMYGSNKAAGTASEAADIQADASTKAAELQADATKYASDQILQGAREGTGLQELMYLLGREDMAPWTEVGGEALYTLRDLIQPGGYLAEEYPEFTGQMNFDESKVQADPGFEFRMKEGQKAIERSAAARGGLLSGAAAKALERFSQGTASDEYSRAYNRQYGKSIDEYNQSLERYRTNFGVDQANRGNLWDRLSALSGIGSGSASRTADLGSGFATSSSGLSQSAANNAANLGVAGANAQAEGITGSANARASGLVAGGNATQAAMQSISQLPMQSYMLWQLLKKP